MTLQDMNFNISCRQIKRQNYQQNYFKKERQLDTISIQVQQLQEQLVQAENMHNSSLAQRLRNKIKELIEKWNSARG